MKKWLVLIFLPLVLLVSCATTPTTSSADVYEYMKTVPIINKGGLSSWDVNSWVNEFNQPTGDKFIRQKNASTGTFTNSATNGSEMSAWLYCEKSDFEIALIEYDMFPVTGGSSDYPYSVEISISFGDTIQRLGNYSFTGKRIYVHYPKAVLQLYKAFVENPTVKMYIVVDNGFSDIKNTYLFDINTSGFEEMYSKAFIES